MMSTPNGQRGFFWKSWERGGEHWERIRVTAYECPRISPDFLAEERREMAECDFRQEYLCDFSGASSSLFDRRLLDQAMRSDVPPLKFPAWRDF